MRAKKSLVGFMIEIPLTSAAPHFSQEHVIFGYHYVLEFQWIEREHYWVMHVYDAAEKPLALGLRMMLDWPIYRSPQGLTFFLVRTTPLAELRLDSLHKDFMLVAYAAV